MNSVLAETEMDWTASWWPWKVWTQLPNKLSQTLTVPSAQPVAKYFEVPIQLTHVTPSCNKEIVKKGLLFTFQSLFSILSHKRKLQE